MVREATTLENPDDAADATPAASAIPAFLHEQLAASYDEETLAHILAGYEGACGRPVTLRANALKASTEEVAAALEAAGIGFERVPWYPDAFMAADVRERDLWALDIYREGGIYLQSLSSMLPPLALQPKAGADILDMCAAPGGKTLQIAALTHGRAHICACELNAGRAEKLGYNLEKLGASNVQLMRTDARRLDEFFRFDAILLDAPCTGSGTVRAHDPRVGKRLTPALLAKTTKSQRALLDRGLTVLKSGGRLVYSTCSVLPAENQDIVRGALKRHRDCHIVPLVLGAGPAQTATAAPAAHGNPHAPAPVALSSADAGAFAVPTLPCDLDGCLTVAPTRLFEGFFVAVIEKH